MRASRESWGRRAPNATKKARGAEHRKRHAVLMCSCGAPRFTISPTFGRSRSTATVSRQHSHESGEKTSRPGSRIPIPHRRPRAHGARSSDAQSRDSTQLAGSTADRPASGVIAFTIRRAVCRCHLLSPRAAPTRRSDDQSTACPALPMPSRAAGRSPRREEPVEEVLIRLFRAMAKMASFRGILNIKSLNYELMSENSDYCVSGRDCPSVILSSAVSGAPR